MSTTITTSVRNESGCWEIIDRKPVMSLDAGEVSDHDIGSEPLRIELRVHDDWALASVEIQAS